MRQYHRSWVFEPHDRCASVRLHAQPETNGQTSLPGPFVSMTVEGDPMGRSSPRGGSQPSSARGDHHACAQPSAASGHRDARREHSGGARGVDATVRRRAAARRRASLPCAGSDHCRARRSHHCDRSADTTRIEQARVLAELPGATGLTLMQESRPRCTCSDRSSTPEGVLHQHSRSPVVRGRCAARCGYSADYRGADITAAAPR